MGFLDMFKNDHRKDIGSHDDPATQKQLTDRTIDYSKGGVVDFFTENDDDNKTEEKEEEWIWVEGYKGTDKDMICNNYQYEIGKEFEENKIELCKKGFHFCLKLEDVFSYYEINDFCRYFKVKALARKKDVEEYGEARVTHWGCFHNIDKLVAKKIIFIEELSSDEYLKIYKEYSAIDTYEEIVSIREIGYEKFLTNKSHKQFISNGYSDTFSFILSKYINKSNYNKVINLSKGLVDEGVSIDMRAYLLLNTIKEREQATPLINFRGGCQ